MADRSVDVLTPINVVRLKIGPIDEYGAWTTSTAEPLDFKNRFMTYTDTLTSNTAKLSGCGVVVDTVSKIGSGTISYGVHALSAEERHYILGEDYYNSAAGEQNTVVTKDTQTTPYCCCIHAEELSNGHWNLYKYFKVKFDPNEISVQQISDGSVTYSTTTLKGTYIAGCDSDAASVSNAHYTDMDGAMRAICFDVDPTTTAGQNLIDAWFETPYTLEYRSSNQSGG